MFNLSESTTLIIKQKRELAEIFGIETKNQYEIIDQDDIEIGTAVEISAHLGHFFLRQFFGHWRKFEIVMFDPNSNKILTITHPFRFFFREFHVSDHTGKPIGSIKLRFSLMYKKFDICGLNNRVLFRVKSPWFKFWTFHIERMNQKMATISKKWSGLVNEMFFDKDNFKIDFHHSELDPREKNLILAAAIFIDLIYFEKKAD